MKSRGLIIWDKKFAADTTQSWSIQLSWKINFATNDSFFNKAHKLSRIKFYSFFLFLKRWLPDTETEIFKPIASGRIEPAK